MVLFLKNNDQKASVCVRAPASVYDYIAMGKNKRGTYWIINMDYLGKWVGWELICMEKRKYRAKKKKTNKQTKRQPTHDHIHVSMLELSPTCICENG